MTRQPPTYPTFAHELLAARVAMTLPDHIGLAIRSDRGQRGLSQRGYAAARGWSAARVARLETRAGGMQLGDVEEALEGTGYVLALCHATRPSPPKPAEPTDTEPTDTEPAAATVPPLPVPVRPDHWPRVEVLARVRDGSRRFPPHHDIRQITYPPPWWWASESTRVGSVEPRWTALPPLPPLPPPPPPPPIEEAPQ